jgi:hypothetical protein
LLIWHNDRSEKKNPPVVCLESYFSRSSLRRLSRNRRDAWRAKAKAWVLPACGGFQGKIAPKALMQTIEEICQDQSAWLTQLEQRVAEEKRNRNVIISWWYGRRTSHLPARPALKSSTDQ